LILFAYRRVSTPFGGQSGGEEEKPTRSDPDFGDLLARAFGGDPAAWRVLVGRLSTLILRIAKSYRLVDADACPVCRRTWLAAQLPAGLRDLARLPGSLGRRLARRRCAP
jgi:hypothetical protein